MVFFTQMVDFFDCVFYFGVQFLEYLLFCPGFLVDILVPIEVADGDSAGVG